MQTDMVDIGSMFDAQRKDQQTAVDVCRAEPRLLKEVTASYARPRKKSWNALHRLSKRR